LVYYSADLYVGAGWVPVGPRFSNAVLQALLVLLQRTPPKVRSFDSALLVFFNYFEYQGRRLLIIATTSIRGMLTDLQMSEVFDADTHVPPITTLRSVKKVLREVNLFTREEELSHAMGKLKQAGFGDDEYETGLQIGIKKLLSVIEMARQEPEEVAERLVRALVGLKM
jgi:vesicle-fusing ATPase